MINEWPLWSSLKGARYYQYTYNSHDWYEELIHAFLTVLTGEDDSSVGDPLDVFGRTLLFTSPVINVLIDFIDGGPILSCSTP